MILVCSIALICGIFWHIMGISVGSMGGGSSDSPYPHPIRFMGEIALLILSILSIFVAIIGLIIEWKGK
jgi:hypothetical protein